VEAVDERAVAGDDLRAGQRLGRHAQRIADRQAVQRAAGPVKPGVEGAHTSTSAADTTSISGA
jgi:hypothetical protein